VAVFKKKEKTQMKETKLNLNAKNDDIPDAYVTIKHYERARLWVLHKCPICGDRHIHGAGEIGEGNPCRYLGHRNPHCQPFFASSGYNLVWDPEDRERYHKKNMKNAPQKNA
jgi:hypothetical protein